MKVLVICGGESSERSISLRSGNDLYGELKKLYGSGVDQVDFKWKDKEKIAWNQYDFVVNALHGGYGENGEIQQFLEENKVKFLGEGSFISDLLFDKWKTKEILSKYGYYSPEGFLISKEKIEELQKHKSFFPCVVKPRSEGSSVGAFFLSEDNRLDHSKLTYEEYICERYIEGIEISISFFFGEILPIIEIRKKGKMFDYETKYSQEGQDILYFLEDSSDLPLSCEEIKKVSFNVCQEIGVQSFCRLDAILNSKGLCILEVNTIPGLKKGSLVPTMAQRAGLDYRNFVRSLVERSLKENK